MKIIKSTIAALFTAMVMLSFFAVPAEATYRRGDDNQEIYALQNVLAAKGHFKEKANGKYGPATEKAVKAFQKAAGLSQDGVAGDKTLQKLGIASSDKVSFTGKVQDKTGYLNLRMGPSTANKAIAEIKNGTSVSVLQKSGAWYKVRLSGGIEGYLYATGVTGGSTGGSTNTGGSAVAGTQGTVRVTSRLNVRKSANTSAEILCKLNNGAKVSILETASTNWLKIKTAAGQTGFVNNNYIVAGASSSGGSSTAKPTATLRRGDENANVVALQDRLKQLGYFTANTTGYYGTITFAAVKAFQKKAGLSQDGVAGTKTLEALFDAKAPGKNDKTEETPAPKPEQTEQTKDKIDDMINYAKQFLGVPYVMGGNGPKTFDCTGFTCYVFKKYGYSLPRTAYSQGYTNYGTKITSMSDLKRGDLVFFNTLPDNDLSDHAGIYLGNNEFIHAGGTKVNIAKIDSKYWKSVFSWGRRVFN